MCTLNKRIETYLKIHPHIDDSVSFLQKCKIPSEVFPSSVFPGAVVKCSEENSQKEFICKLFPLNNKYEANYCLIDESVVLNRNANACDKVSKDSERRISSIEVLDTGIAKKLSLLVTLNEFAFKNPEIIRSSIESLLRNILGLYVLVRQARIKFDSIFDYSGISEILICDAFCEAEAFKITSETEIIIEDFKYSSNKWMKFTELEDLDDVHSKLKELVNESKILGELPWKIKPSLKTLIIGLPGSGKTSICHNFFLEETCNVFDIIPAKIIGQYPGETEECIRRIFQNAVSFTKIFKPKDLTVIFVENIELICPNKMNLDNSSHSVRIGSQFLSLVDLIHQGNCQVLVVGTTSNIEMVDAALRRPGRFENEISIPLLSEKGRKNILKKFLQTLPYSITGENVENVALNLAEQTAGFTGADMKLLLHNLSRKIVQKSGHTLHVTEFKLSDVQNILEELLKVIKPSTLRGTDVTCLMCSETLDAIGGMTQLKKSLRISVLTALRKPEVFRKFDLELPKGILFYGPPGCAKTTFAKCLATETKMTFISTSGAEVYSPYVGKAEKFISKIFDTARKNSPCIIFLDEIDTLVGNRSVGASNDVQTRVLSTLLTEMDGIGLRTQSNFSIENENKILLIAATNRPDMVDNALMRPGRFDKLIHIPAPDHESRLEIFKICKNRMPFNEDVNIEILADKTEQFSGADICNLCNESAIQALSVHPEKETISKEDFNEVLKKFKPSLSKSQIKWYNDFEKEHIR